MNKPYELTYGDVKKPYQLTEFIRVCRSEECSAACIDCSRLNAIAAQEKLLEYANSACKHAYYRWACNECWEELLKDFGIIK